jgi:hypothetical protein
MYSDCVSLILMDLLLASGWQEMPWSKEWQGGRVNGKSCGKSSYALSRLHRQKPSSELALPVVIWYMA